MNIGRSLTYVFDDERWITKLGIAGGIVLLGIVGIVVLVGPFVASALIMGYTVAIARNVRRGDRYPLPEWDDVGDYFITGLRLLIAQLIWMIPLFVLFIPIVLLGMVADSGGAGEGPAALALMCLYCIIALASPIYLLITPAIYARFIETDSIGGAVDVGRVLGFTRDHLADLLVVLVVTLAASVVSNFGLLLCCVGIAFTTAWVYFVQGHLYGQLLARADGGDPSRVDDWGSGAGPAPAGPDVWERAETPPAGMADPEDVVAEVRRRGEEALGEYEDVTVRLGEDRPEVADESAGVGAPEGSVDSEVPPTEPDEPEPDEPEPGA